MGTLTSILKISVAAAMLATAVTATAQNTQRLAATKANDYALVYTHRHASPSPSRRK